MASSINYSSIIDYPFQPFTKIYSADINGMFAIIQTPLAFTRYGTSSCLASGTANYAVFNDSSGNLTEAAVLPIALGGLGANLTPSGPLQAGQTVTVNAAGTGFILSPSGSASTNVFNYYNFY